MRNIDFGAEARVGNIGMENYDVMLVLMKYGRSPQG